MRITVHEAAQTDRPAWQRMRAALWPEASDHDRETHDILSADDAWGFIARFDGAVAGFAEISIRKAANGCERAPVPFLEGIWVDAAARRCGVGAQLLAHIEAFLKKLGFTELGSDSLIDNHTAHEAHRAWGFAETERVVYFRKAL